MNLHEQIINIQFKQPDDVAWTVAEQQAAEIAHRDARHAAAEIVLKYVNFLTDLEREIHADAREATARQVYKAVAKQERPDIAVALILQALNDWYAKGLLHGKRAALAR